MPEIILAGFNLMVMGMGSVFVFLILLVLGTKLMSKVLLALPGGIEAEVKPRLSNRGATQDDLHEIAAVAALVKATHSN